MSNLGGGFVFVSNVLNILGLFLSESISSSDLKYTFKFLWSYFFVVVLLLDFISSVREKPRIDWKMQMHYN